MQEHFQAIAQHLAKREVKKAEILIARCLRNELSDEDRVKLLISRARARLLSARPDDAIDDLQSVNSLTPNAFHTPFVQELLGDSYFARFELSSVGFADRSDTEQAQVIYQRILQDTPNYENRGWIHYQLGRVLLTDSRVEEAVAHFQQALLSASHESGLTAFCYERLGFVACYEERDMGKALAFLDKATDTYPSSADRLWLVQVHILRSRVLRGMYRYDQALQAAEMAVALASSGRGEHRMGLAEALFTTGELLSKLEGREKDVVSYFQQFLQVSKRPLGVDVTWSRVHEMLGDAYFRLGQYDEATSSYLAALQFNPYHPWEISVYFRIGRSYYQKRDYVRAVDAIQRMLDAAQAEGEDIRDYRVYDVLGNAEFALGNYEKAANAYLAALKIAPPNTENLEKIRTYYQYAQELNQSLG